PPPPPLPPFPSRRVVWSRGETQGRAAQGRQSSAPRLCRPGGHGRPLFVIARPPGRRDGEWLPAARAGVRAHGCDRIALTAVGATRPHSGRAFHRSAGRRRRPGGGRRGPPPPALGG